MAEPEITIGANTVVEENASGEPVIRNTSTGTEVNLEAFIDIVGGGLGSAENPVPDRSFFNAAESGDFRLPAGAKLDEDAGELVVRDNTGNIVLRRDESAEAWDFVSTELTNISALEAESLVNGRTSDVLIDEGSYISTEHLPFIDRLDSVSATSFTTIGYGSGFVDFSLVPDGASVYANFAVRAEGVDDTTRVRPHLWDFDSQQNITSWTDVELEFADGFAGHESGWTEVTGINTDRAYSFWRVQADVDSGTSEFQDAVGGLTFAWRVD